MNMLRMDSTYFTITCISYLRTTLVVVYSKCISHNLHLRTEHKKQYRILLIQTCKMCTQTQVSALHFLCLSVKRI